MTAIDALNKPHESKIVMQKYHYQKCPHFSKGGSLEIEDRINNLVQSGNKLVTKILVILLPHKVIKVYYSDCFSCFISEQLS